MNNPEVVESPSYAPKDKQHVCSTMSQMYKFSLYETASRFYFVGADIMDRKFRIVKIDRTADSGDLSIMEDDIVYSKKDMNQLLSTVEDGNRSSGGMKLRSSSWGLLGFIRFTGDYYMLLITKRSQVAMIGGHYIYQIDGTELVSLTSTSLAKARGDRHSEEARFVSILSNLDLSRSFYFSYSYDITNTLQRNIQREREALQSNVTGPPKKSYNEMFVWNHFLLQPAAMASSYVHDWCLPIIHGFVDQASERTRLLGSHVTLMVAISAFNLQPNRLYHDHSSTFSILCWSEIFETRG